MVSDILKIVGVVVIFIGLILISELMLQKMVVNDMMKLSMSGMNINASGPVFSKMNKYIYLFGAVICGWGFVLCLLSPVLGRMIASEKDNNINIQP